MKIIDLLNKIANGEEVPKKIYCFNREFYLKGNTYFGDTFTLMHYIREENLNDEVKILEEEKKDNFTGFKVYQDGMVISSIDYSREEEKKIPEKEDELIRYNIQDFDDLKEFVEITTNDVFGKINKIINTQNKIVDYLKNKGE